MGIWQWILDTIIDPYRSDPLTGEPGEGVEPAVVETAVATLEPPSVKASASKNKKKDEAPWWAPEGAHITELQPVARPDLCTEALALENLLVAQFDGHDLDLPPFPEVPERVLRQLTSSKCDFNRVAEDVADDQVIAAAVIRLASSPLYRGAYKVTSLKPAVTRLGANALKTLMLNQSMRASMMNLKQRESLFANFILERSLASAAIMHGLSKFTDLDSEEALLLGLVHDIGNVIVLREARKQQRFIPFDLDIETFEFLCFECHQEFGELIAESWSLPERIKTVISDHHRYPEPDDPMRTERLLLQINDMICSLIGFAPEQPYDLLASQAVKDLGLDTRADFGIFLCNLPELVDEALDYM